MRRSCDGHAAVTRRSRGGHAVVLGESDGARGQGAGRGAGAEAAADAGAGGPEGARCARRSPRVHPHPPLLSTLKAVVLPTRLLLSFPLLSLLRGCLYFPLLKRTARSSLPRGCPLLSLSSFPAAALLLLSLSVSPPCRLSTPRKAVVLSTWLLLSFPPLSSLDSAPLSRSSDSDGGLGRRLLLTGTPPRPPPPRRRDGSSSVRASAPQSRSVRPSLCRLYQSRSVRRSVSVWVRPSVCICARERASVSGGVVA